MPTPAPPRRAALAALLLLPLALSSLPPPARAGAIESVSGYSELRATIVKAGSDGALLLVDFYAPWCGHCKALEPELERAVEIVEGYGLPVPVRVVKVDATQERNAMQSLGAKGFPTLKAWLPDGSSEKYSHPRFARHVANWLRRKAEPAVWHDLGSAEAVADFMQRGNGDEATYVVLGDPPKAAVEVLREVASERSETLWFGRAKGAAAEEAARALGARGAPAVAAAVGGDGTPRVYDSGLEDADGLRQWLRAARFPLVVPLVQRTFPLLTKDGRPLLVLVGHNDTLPGLQKRLLPLLEEARLDAQAAAADAGVLKTYLADIFHIRQSAKEQVYLPTVFWFHPGNDTYAWDRWWRERGADDLGAARSFYHAARAGEVPCVYSNAAPWHKKVAQSLQRNRASAASGLGLVLALLALAWYVMREQPSTLGHRGPRQHRKGTARVREGLGGAKAFRAAAAPAGEKQE